MASASGVESAAPHGCVNDMTTINRQQKTVRCSMRIILFRTANQERDDMCRPIAGAPRFRSVDYWEFYVIYIEKATSRAPIKEGPDESTGSQLSAITRIQRG